MPRWAAVRVSCGWSGLPAIAIVPARIGSKPTIALASSVRPAPIRPKKPTTSPAWASNEMSRSLASVESPATDSATVLARRPAGAREEVVDVPPDHVLDQAVMGVLADGPGRDVAAVAEHGDAVGDLEDLVELVGDVERRRCRGRSGGG